MKKVVVFVCLMLVACASLFAIPVWDWTNVAFEGGYSFNRSYGQPVQLGLDISHYTIYARRVGFYERFGFQFGLAAPTTDIRIPVSIGVAFSSIIAGGTQLYVGVGPQVTLASYGKTPRNDNEYQYGMQCDLGFRFRTVSASDGDIAIIAGAIGTVSFYHVANESKKGFSGDLLGYVGLSLGLDLTPDDPYNGVVYY